MKRLAAAAFAAALIFAFYPAPSQAGEAVGKAVEVHGNVKITHGGEKAAHALKGGDAIMQADVIETGDAGRAKIVFIDKTQLSIANKGRLTIDEYVFDPKAAGNHAKISVSDLAFSYISGLIDKNAKPDVTIKLNYGTIGIRGTKIYRAMDPRHQCWIFVERGVIDVTNGGGKITLKSGEGTRMSSTSKAPESARPWTHKQIRWVKAAANGEKGGPNDWQ